VGGPRECEEEEERSVADGEGKHEVEDDVGMQPRQAKLVNGGGIRTKCLSTLAEGAELRTKKRGCKRSRAKFMMSEEWNEESRRTR
jgi:hypothetical protein